MTKNTGVIKFFGVKTISVLTALLAPVQVFASDTECRAITVATLDSDGQRGAWYALERGLIETNTNFTLTYLQVPALVQATASDQFNIIETSMPGFVRARLASGQNIRIVGIVGAVAGNLHSIYTRNDSTIQSAEDLRGKTIGIFALGSTIANQAQIVLNEGYGIDLSINSNDLRIVELDPPTLLNALRRGDVDAAVLNFQAEWLAMNDNDLRKVMSTAEEFRNLLDGALPLASYYTASNAYVTENMACVQEFQRVLRASVAYAEENVASFSAEIEAVTGVPSGYVEYYWDPQNYQFVGTTDAEVVGWAQRYHDVAFQLGYLPVSPDLSEIIVRFEE
jgi:ABC-type nitrate/sulfonate/bicarbonate transport system substrate-binding protein